MIKLKKRLIVGMLMILSSALFYSSYPEEKMNKSEEGNKADKPALNVIPIPAKYDLKDGVFTINEKTVIASDPDVKNEAEYFVKVLEPALGYKLQIVSPESTPKENVIVLKIDGKLDSLTSEGYKLSVKKDKIEARSGDPAGIFYAIQTLRQMLPNDIFKTSAVNNIKWTIPCAEIEDKPSFEWRGHLFDCCRHFFTVDTVKRSIDLLALHKMNVLHWHLTEDQGWRIEIKKYPKLTEVGAWRIEPDGSKYGGFYSQAEIRDIVKYAAERHIMVVPEIEMPGHSTAALASYPEYGCTGGPYKVANNWGVFTDVYCAGNDETFVFMQNVLDEVMELFPSPYIHIGGDECPKEAWKKCPKCQDRIKKENLKNEDELQSYFIKRMDKYITEKGKFLIGWDEILEGGLSPNAIVQSWRGIKGGIEAAKQNHPVIMSPTSHCYIDYGYSGISLEKAYSYNPIPSELPKDKVKLIKGLEGNMWTEHVPNQDRLDYQVYPRLSALAEVGWSPAESKNWKNFESRMLVHYDRFKIIGVKYGYDELEKYMKGSTKFGEWKGSEMKKEGVELSWDFTPNIKEAGDYAAIFLFKNGDSAVEITYAALYEGDVEICRDTHKAWSGADKRDIAFKLPVKEIKKDSKYTLKAKLIPQGGTNSNGDVLFKYIVKE